MKIFAVILSLFFLGLNLMPCEDAPNNLITNSSVPSEQSVEQERQKCLAGEFCSPFCHCHCCHVNLVVFEPADFSVYDLEISTIISTRLEAPEKDFLSSILQPPRV